MNRFFDENTTHQEKAIEWKKSNILKHPPIRETLDKWSIYRYNFSQEIATIQEGELITYVKYFKQ